MSREERMELSTAQRTANRQKRKVASVSRVLAGIGAITLIGHVLASGPAPVPFFLAVAWLALLGAQMLVAHMGGRQHTALVAAFSAALRTETRRVRKLVLRLRSGRSRERRRRQAARSRRLTRPAEAPARRVGRPQGVSR